MRKTETPVTTQASKFRVIVCDPPWGFNDRLKMSTTRRGAASHYPTLTAATISELRLGELAEEDSVLVLWYPDSFLRDAIRCFDSWGFRQTQQWTWVKSSKTETRLDDDVPDDIRLAFGMGRLARNCCEHMLVGVRGSPYRHLVSHSVRNVFVRPSTPHSTKPEAVQDALDEMFPGSNRLEVFARRQRPGWTCIGNESPSTDDEDIRDTLKRMLEGVQ